MTTTNSAEALPELPNWTASTIIEACLKTGLSVFECRALLNELTTSKPQSSAVDTIPMPLSLTPEMKAVLKEVAPKWNAESIYSSLIEAAPTAVATLENNDE